MKYLKFSHLYLIIIWLLVGFASCSNDEDDLIKPSTTLIKMEGEGGETILKLSNGDWNIAGVLNLNGNVNIAGEVYSSDGKIIRENDILKLEGMGQLDANWGDKGFRIIRDELNSLKLIVAENATDEDFNFSVVLQSGTETKEVKVTQKKSQGYRFDKIEYSLKEGDKDSLYIIKGITYNYNVRISFEQIIYPINGTDANAISYFMSSDPYAFKLLKNDLVKVQVPSFISDNKIYYYGEESFYNKIAVTKPSIYQGVTKSITIPAGKSEFYTEMEFRKRSISYTLTLINNRTEQKKIIEGKWIEIAPTGKSEIVMKITESN